MKSTAIILAHAFVGWALCAATIGVGFSLTTEFNALVIHAVAAPVYFSVLSWNYFRKYHFTTPLRTAVYFLGFTMIVDFVLVAGIIQRDFGMFESVLGTWLPFGLIFVSTFAVGRLVHRSAT
jgi:hypothetical protein